MVVVIALLIVPGTQHRIVFDGQITPRLQRIATIYTGWALLPFAVSLGLDIYIALAKAFGPLIGMATGAFFTLLALFFWYGLEFGWMPKPPFTKKPNRGARLATLPAPKRFPLQRWRTSCTTTSTIHRRSRT